LLIVTAIAAFEYFKQIRMAHKEYEKARDFIEDIVLSFDRELKRESDRFESMTFKVEGSFAKADASLRKTDSIEKKITPIEEQLNGLTQSYQAMTQTNSKNLTEAAQTNTTIFSKLSGLETKLKDTESTQEILRNKIAAVEEQIQKLSSAQPQEVKNAIVLPPIPIRRDKALAALTDTEIAVLEMLFKEGPKTAPEIKERVNLSREHTARLMKKLYEEGYLEREAGKIPFKYSMRKEVEALLQKSETPSTGL
jgi:chromosome segregation ATPase